MILLSGHSITPERKVPTQSLGVTLKERDSTATMVPLDMTGITGTSWFYDEKQPGGGTAWRVKSITEAYDTHTPTVQLEHVINTLKDRIMFGEITPGMMAGNDKATVCTAEQAIRYILSYQSDWVLGDLQYNVANPYKFNGDTLFDALETVTNSLKDAWWAYDTTVYPFRLLIIQKNNSVFSEMRCGRNIKTIKKTVDKSGMFTRFYPIGKDDLHIDGDFVEMNSYQFGVISKVDTDASIDNKDELRRWAAEQLEIHSRPTVTIDVDGFELADATGESLDSLTLGRVCRVPMPEYSMTFEERIVSIQYPDKQRQPNAVKVTLSNSRTDVMKVIADAMKKSSGGGRKAAVQQKEDHAWFVDTDEKVGMVAESIVGTGDGVWKRISSLVVDGEGIHAKVQKSEGDIVTAFTRIDENENRIILEAQRATGAESALSASITVEAGRITQEVTNRINGQNELSSRITQTATAIQSEVTNRINSENELSSRITQTATAITQEVSARILGDTNLDSRITQTANKIDLEVTRAKAAEGTLDGRITVEAGKITQIVSAVGQNGDVTAASICLAINNGGSSATINAGKIYLLGDTIANTVTANYIDAKIETLATLHAKDISCNSITAGTNIYGPNGLSLYANGLWTVTLTGPVNDVYTLKQTTLNGTESVIGTFSKAVTLSGAWSSGTVTVSAGGNSWYSTLKSLAAGDVSWNGNTASFNVMAYNNGSESPISTGRTMSLDVSARYNAGWSDSWDVMTLNYSSDQEINPGGSITIYPRAKPTPAAEMQQKTSQGVKVTAKAPTDLDVYDYNNYNAISTQTLGYGDELEICAAYKTGTDWTWSSKITITAPSKPTYNYSMKCTSVVNNGGVLTNTFTTTGAGFSAGSSYGFWRE